MKKAGYVRMMYSSSVENRIWLAKARRMKQMGPRQSGGSRTKARNVIIVVAVLVLVVAGVVYTVLSSSPTYTTNVQCTDSGIMVYSAKASNGTVVTATTTFSTSYSTTTSISATVGQTTTEGNARLQNVSLPSGTSGGTIISITHSHSCTYVK